MLYFISSNQRKIQNAKQFLEKLSITIEVKELPIQEIQSDNIDDIVKHKAEQAFENLQKPLIITDHGWYIHGLNGFPGPYMKYMNEWLTPQNFLDLTLPLTDRRVTLKEVVCYKDKNHTKIFFRDHHGELLKEIRGEGYPAMTVISHIKGMSNAEARNKGITDYIQSGPLWEEFATWYKTIEKE